MKRISLPTRLFINKDFKLGSVIEIESKQMHYLSNVMRKKIGDEISIFNGFDGEYLFEIFEKNKKQIFCRCKKKIREQKNEKILWLIFAPLRKERLFFLIEKSTELGVTNFQPVITENTQIKKINSERLFLNACEASEQTERLSVPKFFPLQKLENFIIQWPSNNLIIFCDETGINSLNKLLDISKINFPIGVLVGPEGGFSENERKYLNGIKYVQSVSLGKRILRSDTAAVSSLSIIQSISGDWYGE